MSETIAQTLGANDGLAEHIGERELLLLLDNFEQVVEAAPELSEVLERCINHSRALHALRSWLDSWSGIGRIAVGMVRQGYDLQLTQYDDRG